ncbi:MAG: penicillin-insensitive murein endopeptidase [Deltaproteobacteria bacterium]|nr:penicillin-insensitive murein endopeptidase [Deltaproteobacteria bacterium]MBK8237403.1 penicillin-insensitive murein endopeptidase [Deltaproteobacteria bacterium]MBP7285526.1 penicillin-insensitive murein endopeptidase [Nannocystaceae bacterium]
MGLRRHAIVGLFAVLALGAWHLEPAETPTPAATVALATAIGGAPAVAVPAAQARRAPEPLRAAPQAPVFPNLAALAATTRAAAAVADAPPEPALEPIVAPPADAVGPDELLQVRWTVERRMPLVDVAGNWGMWPKDLRELNPGYDADAWVDAGTRLVVHVADPRKPTQSVGAPNKGHLLRGIPLPEGPAWRLREHRPRAFGSATTITALLTAMRAYAAADPSAPALRIGELSRRSGGHIDPHVSHRSGRDVDIGYVLKDPAPEGERFWRAATESSIDAPRTWAFVQALIATGDVQQIFISAKLQRVLAREAAKHVSREEVERIFSAANPDARVHTIVKHEHGHRDHMHVRFACEDGNLRCRSSSVEAL